MPASRSFEPKEGIVTNSNVMTFTLVPQTDRRQQPDRRKSWRGSRRAADLIAHEPSQIDVKSAAKWNTLGGHASAAADVGEDASGSERYDVQADRPARKLYVH